MIAVFMVSPKDFLECYPLHYGMTATSISRALSYVLTLPCSVLQFWAPFLTLLPAQGLQELSSSSPCSPHIPKSLSRPETLASSSSLSYFFLLCVQVIITTLSPPSAFLEVCRPFSLSLLASAKTLSRHASLTTQHPPTPQ
jgi:hypothetical protein